MKHSPITKNILILVTTVTVTAIIFHFFQKYNSAIEDKELYASYISDLEKEKTLESKTSSTDSKVNEFTIGDIYGDYEKNKIAFNKKSEGKVFEFVGFIDEFKTTLMGCSAIRFNIANEDNSTAGYVNCINCPELVDKWKKEIIKLKVGDKVKIRGYYTSALDDNTLTFKNCRLIK